MELKDLVIAIFDEPNMDLKDELDACLKACFYVSSVDEAKSIFNNYKIDAALIGFDTDQNDKLSIIKYLKTRNDDFPVIVLTAQTEKVKKFLSSQNILDFMDVPLTKEKIAETLSKNLETIVKYSKRDHGTEELTETLTIKEAIDLYFQKIADDLMAYKNNEFSERRMSFEIMRRFLFTAYNNLMEIDYSLEDRELKTVREKFECVIKLKNDFENKVRDTIEASYEKIYLRKNTEYMALGTEFEDIKTKMGSLRNELGILTRQLDEAKVKKKNAKPDSPDAKMYEDAMKRINGKHVDKVHELTGCKDSIYDIDEQLEAIRKKYFDEFKETFEEEIDRLRFDLKDVLDLFSYRFDRILWHQAKASRNVREFFKDAKIKGLLSSKTYIQYYVQGLDEGMASNSTKKVIKYINDYNLKNKRLIALVGKDVVELSKEKNIISQIDPILEGRMYPDPAVFLRKFEIEEFDLVIFDWEIARRNAADIVDFLKAKFPQKVKPMTFAVRFKRGNTPENQNRALKSGVKHFFFENMNKEDFADTVLRIM